MPVETTTINITPTNEGYANIALTFAHSVMTDVKMARRNAVAEQLGQLVRIAGYLGSVDPQALLDLQAEVERL